MKLDQLQDALLRNALRRRFHDDFMQHGFASIAIVQRGMLHVDSPVS